MLVGEYYKQKENVVMNEDVSNGVYTVHIKE